MSGTRLPGSGARGHSGAPNDLELMMYFDGELDDERAKEVETFLRAEPAARQKLAGLELASALVREVVLEKGNVPSADVAGQVMARVAAEPRPAPHAEAPAAAALRPTTTVPAASAKPANDNARRIFALAALAVAAAAALMIWARSESPTPKAVLPAPPAPVAQTAAERPALLPSAEPVTPDQDVDVPVQIAAVDFGAQTGAIFYVPSDAHSAEHATTVVWLADEIPGGQ